MCSENSATNFIRHAHSVGLNQFHFEWCSKYRYKTMKREDINKFVEQAICQAACEHGISIHTMSIGFEHVHVFASLPLAMSPSDALMLLKGRSAYLIFRQYPNFRKLYGAGHFWSAGKFARSVSNITSSTVKRYIENQQFEELNNTIHSIDEEPRQLNLTHFM